MKREQVNYTINLIGEQELSKLSAEELELPGGGVHIGNAGIPVIAIG